MLQVFEGFSLPWPVLGALIGLLGVWIGSFLASKRAYDDRIWQRKAEAYGKILEALNIMMGSYDDNLRDLENNSKRDSDYHEKHHAVYRLAKQQLFSTVAREVWLLPVSVKTETDALAKVLDKDHENLTDHLNSQAFGIERSIKQIEALATADLKRSTFLAFLKA